MNKNIIKDGDIVGQIDYDIIPNAHIIYIHEIAIFGTHKRKGFGTKALWDIFTEHKGKPLHQMVGIAIDDTKLFWEKLGAEFSEPRASGDMCFSLNKWDLYNKIRK